MWKKSEFFYRGATFLFKFLRDIYMYTLIHPQGHIALTAHYIEALGSNASALIATSIYQKSSLRQTLLGVFIPSQSMMRSLGNIIFLKTKMFKYEKRCLDNIDEGDFTSIN